MIYVLMFLVHLTATLTYATRIVAVRTKMLALTLSMFNFITFFYRTVNGFQAPFLAKFMEINLSDDKGWDPYSTFMWLMVLASVASVAGLLLLPATQRIVTKAVEKYASGKSFSFMLKALMKKEGITSFGQCLSIPTGKSVRMYLKTANLPWNLLIINVITTGFMTVGILSAIYAGFLNPEFRTTASTLSFIMNGIAAILLYVFVDPPLGLLTDRAMQGTITEPYFRRVIVWFGITRVAGTILAQALFIPMAYLVSLLAGKI